MREAFTLKGEVIMNAQQCTEMPARISLHLVLLALGALVSTLVLVAARKSGFRVLRPFDGVWRATIARALVTGFEQHSRTAALAVLPRTDPVVRWLATRKLNRTFHAAEQISDSVIGDSAELDVLRIATTKHLQAAAATPDDALGLARGQRIPWAVAVNAPWGTACVGLLLLAAAAGAWIAESQPSSAQLRQGLSAGLTQYRQVLNEKWEPAVRTGAPEAELRSVEAELDQKARVVFKSGQIALGSAGENALHELLVDAKSVARLNTVDEATRALASSARNFNEVAVSSAVPFFLLTDVTSRSSQSEGRPTTQLFSFVVEDRGATCASGVGANVLHLRRLDQSRWRVNTYAYIHDDQPLVFLDEIDEVVVNGFLPMYLPQRLLAFTPAAPDEVATARDQTRLWFFEGLQVSQDLVKVSGRIVTDELAVASQSNIADLEALAGLLVRRMEIFYDGLKLTPPEEFNESSRVNALTGHYPDGMVNELKDIEDKLAYTVYSTANRRVERLFALRLEDYVARLFEQHRQTADPRMPPQVNPYREGAEQNPEIRKQEEEMGQSFSAALASLATSPIPHAELAFRARQILHRDEGAHPVPWHLTAGLVRILAEQLGDHVEEQQDDAYRLQAHLDRVMHQSADAIRSAAADAWRKYYGKRPEVLRRISML